MKLKRSFLFACIILIIITLCVVYYVREKFPQNGQYQQLHIWSGFTAQEMWNIPSWKFHRQELFGELKKEKNLISLKTITGPNCGLDRYLYTIEINSKEDFIQFCQNHSIIDSLTWSYTFSDAAQEEKIELMFHSLPNWSRVKESVKTEKVNGLNAYILDFKHFQCRYYRLVVFSNGVVFINASCGI